MVIDHYGSQYDNFENEIVSAVRQQAFGEDIGQTGWNTADEQDLFIQWLGLKRHDHLLDIACGSGRPAMRIAQKTGCQITGVDLHDDGITSARRYAENLKLSGRATFHYADASRPLPFEDETFDAITCIDAINHLPDRIAVLKEWRRILKPSGMLIYTDPIIATGPLTNEEIAIRSSIGFFLFMPVGLNERMLAECGFSVDRAEDRTLNMAKNARQWFKARSDHEAQLRAIEQPEDYEGQQVFFQTAARLAAERRLSRFAFMARRN